MKKERYYLNRVSVDLSAIFLDWLIDAVLFPITFLNKKKWAGLKKYKPYLKRIVVLQRKYAKKNDVTTIPNIYYCFLDHTLKLRLHLNQRAIEKDYLLLAEEIKTVTGLYLINFTLHNGDGYVEFGRLEDNHPSFNYQEKIEDYAIPLGTEYGKNVKWVFKRFPHILIVGSTGSGKSVAILYFLSSILRFYKVYCIDGKEVDYIAYKDYFHGYCGAMDKENSILIVKVFYEKMKFRYEKLKELEIPNIFDLKTLPFQPEFLLIDEFTSFVETLDKKEKEEFMGNVGHIARLGRAVGMNLIIAMQRPDTKFISGEIRENLTVKIVMGNASKETYRMAFDHADLQLLGENPGLGYVDINGKVHQIAVPYQKGITLE